MAFVEFLECVAPLEAVNDALDAYFCRGHQSKKNKMKLKWTSWERKHSYYCGEMV